MGIPQFFRWLSKKFPKCIVSAVENDAPGVNTADLNPNGLEFDNLYLDMNGIVHPCCHPEQGPAPATEEEMLSAVFTYIDRLFSIVRPRRLLYLAIDGVAPRAKINQQRSRRFKAARDAAEKVSQQEAINNKLAADGQPVNPVKKSWDSNVITPGTPFMDKLSQALRFYINQHLSSDPGWKGIKVILSDSSVPGEGEHKIVDYIRKQKNKPGYPPNMRHCMYGLDADLIMLSLATHEPHFSLVREVVPDRTGPRCFLCGERGHYSAQCPTKNPEQGCKKKPFQFLHINILREYLENTLGDIQANFALDFERLIDDWVFVCFLVGNDFLPHSPTLEIENGALDLLIDIYKKKLPQMGSYITDSGTVIIPNAMCFIEEVSHHEENLLIERNKRESRFNNSRGPYGLSRFSRQPARQPHNMPPQLHNGPTPPQIHNVPPPQSAPPSKQQPIQNAPLPVPNTPVIASVQLDSSNFGAAELLKNSLLAKAPLSLCAPLARHATLHSSQVSQTIRPTAPQPPVTPAPSPNTIAPAGSSATPFRFSQPPGYIPSSISSEPPEEDKIQLGTAGWRERYYGIKFNKKMDDKGFFTELCSSYVTGLCWVLKYYYQGCCSWTWFYPYHYSPFAAEISKFVDRENFSPFFDLGEPFRPFEQLMGVLPAASGHCLPQCFANLMSDPKSPIIDFYPLDFAVDRNGKKQAWAGVVLLPFIDEKRLVQTLKMHEDQLTPEESYRNRRYGNDVLYIHKAHPIATTAITLYKSGKGSPTKGTVSPVLEFEVHQMVGSIQPYFDPLLKGTPLTPGTTYPGFGHFKDIVAASVASYFSNPVFVKGKLFPSFLPDGCELPPRQLTEADFGNARGEKHVPSITSSPRQPPAATTPPATIVDKMVKGAKDRYLQTGKTARFTAIESRRAQPSISQPIETKPVSTSNSQETAPSEIHSTKEISNDDESSSTAETTSTKKTGETEESPISQEIASSVENSEQEQTTTTNETAPMETETKQTVTTKGKAKTKATVPKKATQKKPKTPQEASRTQVTAPTEGDTSDTNNNTVSETSPTEDDSPAQNPQPTLKKAKNLKPKVPKTIFKHKIPKSQAPQLSKPQSRDYYSQFTPSIVTQPKPKIPRLSGTSAAPPQTKAGIHHS
ncbi:5'-3' exoribonuclease 3 [Pelomyxa schiedti]|nr:5'-3' exoribonuclease 3 [Pelomyxa schiedti]